METPEQQNSVEQLPKTNAEEVNTLENPAANEAAKDDVQASEPSRPSVADKQPKKSSKKKNSKKQAKSVDDEPEDSKKPKPKKKKIGAKKILKRIGVVFLVILVGLAIFCSWNRWYRYDDAADIQGTWQLGTGTNTVVIDDQNLTLQKNAVLQYTLDNNAKMINFKIGNMSGSAHYRFSPDRKNIAICEDSGDNVITTAWSDAGWFFNMLFNKIAGNNMSVANTDLNKTATTTDTSTSIIPENGGSVLLTKVQQQ